MIGIFVITHGTLGESLIQCVSHVLDRRPSQLMQLGIAPQDDPSEVLPAARRMLDWTDSGQGVVILTDIYGATPANIASRLLAPGHVEGIAGVNLPMLLRVLTHRENDLDTLVRQAVGGACDGVLHMQ